MDGTFGCRAAMRLFCRRRWPRLSSLDCVWGSCWSSPSTCSRSFAQGYRSRISSLSKPTLLGLKQARKGCAYELYAQIVLHASCWTAFWVSATPNGTLEDAICHSAGNSIWKNQPVEVDENADVTYGSEGEAVHPVGAGPLPLISKSTLGTHL